jgi:hypothetical protein
LDENPWTKEKGIRKPKKYNPKFKRICPTFGKEHGSQVHKEIEIFVREFTKTQKFDSFYKYVKQPDPCTVRIIQKCLDENWYPIVSEFKIYDEDIKIATSCDLIVCDQKTLKLILIEIKTGYEDEMYGKHPTDKTFKRPFQKITNCPLFRHHFQLLSMQIMLQKKYKITVDAAYILRSMPKEKTLEVYSSPVWARNKDYKSNLYTLLGSES